MFTCVDYAYAAISTLPAKDKEAVSGDDARHWKAEMDTEIATLKINNTWTLKPLPNMSS